jgi:transcriptional regulator with XRE-family HTH domain
MEHATQAPTWGSGIKYLRGKQGLTQTALADKIGCSQVSISRLEQGSRKVSDAMRVRIARALDVDPYRLFPYEHRDDDVA